MGSSSEELGHGDRRIVHGGVHHRHVDLSAGQLEDERRGGGIEDQRPDLGVGVGEVVEEAGDEPSGRRPDHSEPNGADHLVLEGGDVAAQR